MNENLINSLNQVNAEISDWRTTWVHKNPCKEWVEHEKIHGRGFCKHLVDARYRKFGKRLEQIFGQVRNNRFTGDGGMKDIHGKEIKEGDEIRVKWGGGGLIVSKNNKLWVAFEHGEYVIPLTKEDINYRETEIKEWTTTKEEKERIRKRAMEMIAYEETEALVWY